LRRLAENVSQENIGTENLVTTLVYVSQTLLTFPESDQEVDNIIAVSRIRNAALHVTGALISTPNFFAQLLEGPRASIDELMLSITRDHRHKNVTTVSITQFPGRQFSGWSMAYSGYASYVDQHIAPLFARLPGQEQDFSVKKLVRLMQEFTKN
jgi:hypothetical protein